MLRVPVQSYTYTVMTSAQRVMYLRSLCDFCQRVRLPLMPTMNIYIYICINSTCSTLSCPGMSFCFCRHTDKGSFLMEPSAASIEQALIVYASRIPPRHKEASISRGTRTKEERSPSQIPTVLGELFVDRKGTRHPWTMLSVYTEHLCLETASDSVRSDVAR